MNTAQRALILCIRAYRLVISPAKLFVFGSLAQCRFTPSCSAFALEAISRHGARAGSWLALKRIVRCHPWGGCGHDPVPGKKSHDQSPKSKAQTARGCASHPADPRHVSATRLAAGSFID